MNANDKSYQEHLHESSQIWDSEAASFDNEPDHGLRDPLVRAAWTALLSESLPSNKGDVLDIGCGTGSLSLIFAEFGCDVTAIDFSPEMIATAEAKAKAANQQIEFHVMDAAFPQFAPTQFDVIVCRHLLWALPEPDQVLRRWVRLLKPRGRLLLIEGFWHTGVGLHAQQIIDALPASVTKAVVRSLSDQTDLWGRTVEDERYIIVADFE